MGGRGWGGRGPRIIRVDRVAHKTSFLAAGRRAPLRFALESRWLSWVRRGRPASAGRPFSAASPEGLLKQAYQWASTKGVDEALRRRLHPLLGSVRFCVAFAPGRDNDAAPRDFVPRACAATMLYFAYGSNLHHKSLGDWCRHYGHKCPALRGGRARDFGQLSPELPRLQRVLGRRDRGRDVRPGQVRRGRRLRPERRRGERARRQGPPPPRPRRARGGRLQAHRRERAPDGQGQADGGPSRTRAWRRRRFTSRRRKRTSTCSCRAPSSTV